MAPSCLRVVDAEQDLPAVRRIFVEYASTLGVDLSFQDFEGELAALPRGAA